MIAAETAGKTGPQLQAVEDEWITAASLKTFDEAVAEAVRAGRASDKEGLIKKYLAAAKGKGNGDARRIAKEVTGLDVFFDWDASRTREGYFRLKGGCECAINRAVAYAPYCDAIWMESKLPDYAQAEEFARGVHAKWPEMK
jgi:isocitrate lyase